MPERQSSRKHADDPGQLARELVGAEEEHLRHVDEHERDHEVRAPAVHRAKEPAERLLGSSRTWRLCQASSAEGT